MSPPGWHIGRHWPSAYRNGKGMTIEDQCPCPTQPCGLVADEDIDPDCPQHGSRSRTIRASHEAKDCPGHRDG